MTFLRLTLLLALTTSHIWGADTSETIGVGKKVTFTVTADGHPAPAFEWFKNDVKVSDGPQFVLPSLTAADSGAYHVKATNEVGSASSDKFILTVDDRTSPIIAMAPLDARIKEGETLILSISALGNPAPTYQWKKNGTDIAGATTSKLTFAPITRSDAGVYTVVATNEKGSATSSGATVEVIYAPSAPIITRTLSNLTVIKKTNVRLRIEAVGDELTYQWKKGTSNLAGRTTPELLLPSVNPSDEGYYTITVRNPHGSGSSTARLTVLR
mgnify:CR=1 FL=1